MIAAVITLLAATLKDKMQQQNAAINAITAYCKVEEGGCDLPSWKSNSTHTTFIVKVEENTYSLMVTKLRH